MLGSDGQILIGMPRICRAPLTKSMIGRPYLSFTRIKVPRVLMFIIQEISEDCMYAGSSVLKALAKSGAPSELEPVSDPPVFADEPAAMTDGPPCCIS